MSEWNQRNGAPCSVAVAVRAPDAGCCHRGPACRRRNRGCTARHWCSTVKASTCVRVGEAECAQFASSAARCTNVLLASSTDDSAHASVGAGGGLLAAWPALVANDDVDGLAATRPVSSRSSEVPPWRQRAASDECSPSALVKGSALAIHRCTTAWSSLRAVRWLVLSIASLIQHTCRVTGYSVCVRVMVLLPTPLRTCCFLHAEPVPLATPPQHPGAGSLPWRSRTLPMCAQ